MVANTTIENLREVFSDDTIREACHRAEILRETHEHVKTAIAELKKAGHQVPISLHHAARNLSYALGTERVSVT